MRNERDVCADRDMNTTMNRNAEISYCDREMGGDFSSEVIDGYSEEKKNMMCSRYIYVSNEIERKVCECACACGLTLQLCVHCSRPIESTDVSNFESITGLMINNDEHEQIDTQYSIKNPSNVDSKHIIHEKRFHNKYLNFKVPENIRK